jgi:hypothetical protein
LSSITVISVTVKNPHKNNTLNINCKHLRLALIWVIHKSKVYFKAFDLIIMLIRLHQYIYFDICWFVLEKISSYSFSSRWFNDPIQHVEWVMKHLSGYHIYMSVDSRIDP